MAGSIEKRGENTYRLIVSTGKNLDGSRAKRTKTIHGSRKDAEIALAEFLTEASHGLIPEGKPITFEEFFHVWQVNYGEKELAPSTYKRYVRMLETRILPYLGSFTLEKIKPIDLMKLYDMLEQDTQIRRLAKNNGERTLKPLSKKTILEHHRLISSMLHKAVYWQLIPFTPADRVQPPRASRAKRKFYDDEQCKVLLNNLNTLQENEFKYKVAIILDVFTGARLGELMGLEWNDIDFKNKEIAINKASQYLPEKGIYTKEPKTSSSYRNVSIPDSVVEMLEEYKLWYDNQKELCGEFWHDSDRLFVQDNGKPMHPDTVNKWFGKFIKRIGLPVINFHGIRHTNATLLISQNVDVAVVAARLGHAQISTTFNFYGHSLASHNRSAGIVLQNLLVDKN
ncbi:MAG: site-specific integrase [Clostridia bacterium]|nr:site-specific integrase [Clostridia bacterium]